MGSVYKMENEVWSMSHSLEALQQLGSFCKYSFYTLFDILSLVT